LLFIQASIAGIIAIVVTLASLAILAPGTSAIAHQELIWLGIGLMTLSAIAMLAVREPAKTQARAGAAAANPPAKSRSALGPLGSLAPLGSGPEHHYQG
jgi:hypothetical protein